MRTLEAKVVVLGSQGVGKTSMIMRYTGKLFSPNVSPTIAAAFCECKLNLDNARVKLQVWDTAGQERFRSMAPMYYRNANVAMLVFDLTQYSTFAAIKSWVTELRRNVEEAMVLVVVGNKSDLTKERQVDAEEGRLYAMNIGAAYYETSVLYDEGIDGVFLAIGTSLLRLSSGNQQQSSIRVYDSTGSGICSSDMPLTPSAEESPQNVCIAHGIHEKPHTCC